MLPPAADRPKLDAALGRLTTAVEELLLGGLTTASEATRQTLAVATQEAARARLLRLGSALRAAADELGRYAAQDAAFSRRRLTFFLTRSWLLARGLAHVLRTEDEAAFDRLNWTPASRPLSAVDVVCLGVVKKATAAAVLFDFRLRAADDGRRLSWSFVFPVKPGVTVPAEGFLHLPQKQKFTPASFLDRKVLHVRGATVADGRLSLTEAGTVTVGEAFTEWGRYLDWSPAPAVGRLKAHAPGPLDLETELQEDVVLKGYEVGAPGEGDEPGQTAYPVTAKPLAFHALADDPAVKKGLDALRKPKKDRPPLFGLMHYERCRLVLQPLAAVGPDGPEYLTISKESIDKAALLKALSFT